MRKVLTEGIDDSDSFANRLTDNRYREFAEAFNFARYGTTTTIFDRTRQGTVDRYVRQTLEEDAGSAERGRAAGALFPAQGGGHRRAPIGILADAALLKVVQTALGIAPDDIGHGHRPAGGDDRGAARHRGPQGSGEARQVPRRASPACGSCRTRRHGRHRPLAPCCSASPLELGIGADLLASLQNLQARRDLSMQIEPLRRPVGADLAAAAPRDHRQQRRQRIDRGLPRRGGQVRAPAVARRRQTRSPMRPRGTTYLSRKSGELVQTDNPLDVAVQGDAWLAVQTPDGHRLHARRPHAHDRDRRAAVSVNGQPVLDAGGAPLRLDPNAGPPTIARDGTISQSGRQIGAHRPLHHRPATPSSPASRTRGVIPDRPADPALDFAKVGVHQGYIEGSNVNPVHGDDPARSCVQRAFEAVDRRPRATRRPPCRTPSRRSAPPAESEALSTGSA